MILLHMIKLHILQDSGRRKMMLGNHWGGSFEIQQEPGTDDDHSQCMDTDRGALLRQNLDEIQLGWLRGPQDIKQHKYVDLGCILCKQKVLKWIIYCTLITFIAIGLPIIISRKLLPKHKEPVLPPDKYAIALSKALLFFNAQRCKTLLVLLQYVIQNYK